MACDCDQSQRVFLQKMYLTLLVNTEFVFLFIFIIFIILIFYRDLNYIHYYSTLQIYYNTFM